MKVVISEVTAEHLETLQKMEAIQSTPIPFFTDTMRTGKKISTKSSNCLFTLEMILLRVLNRKYSSTVMRLLPRVGVSIA